MTSQHFDFQAWLAQLQSAWQSFSQSQPLAAPPADKRFAGSVWQENQGASFLANAYLHYCAWANQQFDAFSQMQLISGKQSEQLRFALDQTLAALSPANNLASNPEALQHAVNTQGESLQKGLANLLNDLRKGRITQTDESAFAVGKNLAISAGDVVFENDFFQLLRYQEQTDKVYAKPLLMVPPSINKFYILDLHHETSMVRFLVESGFEVYLVSWRNPQAGELESATWDNYIESGVITAIAQTQKISKQKTINTLGFCVGGTKLAVALGVLAKRGEFPAHSTTFLTTLLEFSQPGVLGVFTDEAQVKQREAQLASGGLMPAKDLNNAFSALRPNDLVWNYVISSYMKGETSAPFDLLYWNGDSTNLPGPMFAWYLRNFYLENRLATPNALVTLGETIDLRELKQDCYVLAAQEDHIVPWQAAYQSAKLLGGEVRFVVGAAGHIAGVINPAHKNKRSYKIGDAAWEKTKTQDAKAWGSGAQTIAGSWWRDWASWLAARSGDTVNAKTLAQLKIKSIEPAPGRYVSVRAMPL